MAKKTDQKRLSHFRPNGMVVELAKKQKFYTRNGKSCLSKITLFIRKKIVNKIGKINGIDSFTKFRYHWTKEVVMDYYNRIQNFLQK